MLFQKDIDNQWAKYLHHHTRLVVAVVVAGFLLLAAGEFYLFRKVMYVNQMVAEGFWQVKEQLKTPPVPGQ